MSSETSSLQHAVEFLQNFLLGGISGSIAKTCTAPIERVKLLIQTQDANPRIISGEVPRYTGIVNCFQRVHSEQGFKAFWRGNMTNIIRYFPTQAFNFAFKDTIKGLFPRYPREDYLKNLGVNVASGGLAGLGSLCIVYPLDYARTRLAADVGTGKRDFSGLWDCLSKTAKGKSGVFGLYNGFGVSACGIIPYRGVYFGMFDTLSDWNPYRNSSRVLSFCSTFLVAQFSAICAGYASYPFDTVRRRLQMQSEKPKEQWVYKGTTDCFTKIIRDEGATALFKGAGANALRTVGSAMVLVLYSEAKKILGLNYKDGE